LAAPAPFARKFAPHYVDSQNPGSTLASTATREICDPRR
jgi:hypothetical protein